MEKSKEKRNMKRKRIEEIENYLLGINGLVNPNVKEITIKNPIAVKSTIEILKELKEELSFYELNISDINLEGIFINEPVSEIDELIKWIGDHMIYSLYGNTYREMLKGEQLEKTYPRAKREERIKELEAEIKTNRQMADMLNEINPSLARVKVKEVYLLEKEAESLRETLYIPTREELITRIWSTVTSRLNNYKLQCITKLDYLEGIL